VRTVTVEEHCLTPELRAVLGAQVHPYYPVHRWPPALEARLADIGEGRIAEMDASGIDVQVLSTTQPGLEHITADRAIPVARAFNEGIAEAIAAHPGRFAGFAALPSADPDASAVELAHSVGELGLCGAMVNGRTLERFLDDEFFWPIFESAEALGVPLYLHPMPPPQAVYDAYYSGFGDEVGFALCAGAFGWHIETGLHALRLMLAGVFDRFPALQVILGHMGEVLPFMIERASAVLARTNALGPIATRMQLSPAEYLNRNCYISTSGFFTDPPLLCALDVIGPDRILFAIDHPFGDNATGRRFLDEAAISEQDRAKIAHQNADRLLGL
jgi:predicted TIM-barrel fold metal-dependent hydrolase